MKQEEQNVFMQNELTLPELTLRGMILGGILTVIFTASNVYLGLKVGLTFYLRKQHGTDAGFGCRYLISHHFHYPRYVDDWLLAGLCLLADTFCGSFGRLSWCAFYDSFKAGDGRQRRSCLS